MSCPNASDRLPTIREVAEELGVTPEEVVFAQEANKPPTSIHETVFENDGDPITLMDQIADESQERWFDKLALNEAIGASQRARAFNRLSSVLPRSDPVRGRQQTGNLAGAGIAAGEENPAIHPRPDRAVISWVAPTVLAFNTNIRQLTTFYRALWRGRLFVVNTGRSRTIGLHDQHHARDMPYQSIDRSQKVHGAI